jgi:hypothetical protein
MIVNRLTVAGKDYFLPEPVDELRQQILEAVRAGGGYVTVPGLRGGPGAVILISPGMPVTWVQLDIADPSPQEATEAAADTGLDGFEFQLY